MNSNSAQRSVVFLLILGCSVSFAEVGEFTVSEKLLDQFQFTAKKTEPFMKRGRLVNPDLDFTVKPRIGDASNAGKFYLDIDLDGSSVSHSKTQVGRRHTVDATVTANVKAQFSQEMTLGENGLDMGRFSGSVNITPEKISTSNDFVLLNGAVNRKAQPKAKAQVASEMPREKKELTEQVEAEVQRGTGEAKSFVDSTLKMLAPAVADKERFPFSTKLSTQTGQEGKLKVEISDIGNNSTRQPKPDFENKSQLMATGIIHQDLLTKTLATEIAGKELKMSQLRKILCSPRMQKLMDFCKLEPNPSADKLSLVFDSKDPIQFIFSEGKVTIKMNASYRTSSPKTDVNDRALLAKPGATKPDFETVPYQVEVSYKIQDGSAKLVKVNVTEKDPGTVDPASLIAGFFRRGNHGDSPTERPSVGALFNPIIKKNIQNEFQKLLADELDFRAASFPTKVREVKVPNGKGIEILEAGSLLPIEVKAENGWLATGNTFCNDFNRPFGVSFSKNDRIGEVQPGSPAELCGFKIGDRLETYSEPEGRSNAFGSSPEAFVSFVAEKAANKNSRERKIFVTGTDASGNLFKRAVFLCPSNINHKEQAAKGLSQFKKP